MPGLETTQKERPLLYYHEEEHESPMGDFNIKNIWQPTYATTLDFDTRGLMTFPCQLIEQDQTLQQVLDQLIEEEQVLDDTTGSLSVDRFNYATPLFFATGTLFSIEFRCRNNIL